MADFVVFYSLTGKSRETAQRLAKAMTADLVEVVEEKPKKPGLLGFAGGILDSLLKRKPKIKSTRQVAASDRIILCGPIWAGCIAGPIRTWLDERGQHTGPLVWVPHSGRGGDWPKAPAEITELTGHAPSQIDSFAEDDFAKGKAESKVRELVASLKAPT